MTPDNKIENRLVVVCMLLLGVTLGDTFDHVTMPERVFAEARRQAILECTTSGVSEAVTSFSSLHENDGHLFSAYLTPGVPGFIAWQCGSYFGQYVFRMPHFYGRPKITAITMGKVPGPNVAPNEVTRLLNVNGLQNAGFNMNEASYVIDKLKGASPKEFNK